MAGSKRDLKRRPPPLAADTLAKFLERATQLHCEGRFDEAARHYEHIQACNPDVLAAPYFAAGAVALAEARSGVLASGLSVPGPTSTIATMPAAATVKASATNLPTAGHLSATRQAVSRYVCAMKPQPLLLDRPLGAQIVLAVIAPALFGLIVNGFHVPGRHETHLGQALEGAPGALLGMALMYVEGIRRGRRPFAT